MKKIVLTAALLAGFVGASAFAQTKVGDWEVEKRAKDEHCNATRAYKDSDNDQNVIVLTYSKDAIVIVFVYEGWEWGKDDKIVKADFATDKSTIVKKAKWEVMDKNTVRGIFEFNPSILDKLSNAKRISLDFDDDDDDSTEFETPRLGEALAALKFCEENKGGSGAAAPPSPGPASPNPPSESPRDRQ